MKTVPNESTPQVPFRARNIGLSVASVAVIWLCGKALPAIDDQYEEVPPCNFAVQSPTCAAYTAATVAAAAMLVLTIYGFAKVLVFDYHPELEYSMPRKSTSVSTTHTQNATKAFFQSSPNGRAARNANASQSAKRLSRGVMIGQFSGGNSILRQLKRSRNR